MVDSPIVLSSPVSKTFEVEGRDSLLSEVEEEEKYSDKIADPRYESHRLLKSSPSLDLELTSPCSAPEAVYANSQVNTQVAESPSSLLISSLKNHWRCIKLQWIQLLPVNQGLSNIRRPESGDELDLGSRHPSSPPFCVPLEAYSRPQIHY